MGAKIAFYGAFPHQFDLHQSGDKVSEAVGTLPDPGYRMITNLSVQNFRSYRAFALRDLRRINIIVGRNAAGKTALLEAIRVAYGGTPTAVYGLNTLRGIPIYVPPNPSRDMFESIWRSYFYDFDPANQIQTRFTDSAGSEAKLRIYFDEENSVTPTAPLAGGVPPSTIIPVAFERTPTGGTTNTLRATIGQQGQLVLEQGPELGPGIEYFPSSWQFNAIQAAQWFSQLSLTNREPEIIKVITEQFPFIRGIDVLSPTQFASLHATIGYLSQKVPLSLVSAGINKVFIVLTAITYHRGGVILLDEVENGLHVRILEEFWRSIHRLLCLHNSQIFLSTHSWECLKAAIPTIDKAPNDFCLLRVERVDRNSRITQFSGADLVGTLEENFDVRD